MPDLSESHERFWEAISAKGIERAAREAGGSVEGCRVLVTLADRRFALDPAMRKLFELTSAGEVEAGFFEYVVLVSYVAITDGSPLSGDWVSEKGLQLQTGRLLHPAW